MKCLIFRAMFTIPRGINFFFYSAKFKLNVVLKKTNYNTSTILHHVIQCVQYSFRFSCWHKATHYFYKLFRVLRKNTLKPIKNFICETCTAALVSEKKKA